MKPENGFDFIYKTIADEAMMAFLFFGADGHLIYANRLAADLFEFSVGASNAHVKVEQFFTRSATERRVKNLNLELLEMQGLIQDVLVKKLNGQSFIANLGVKHVLQDSGHALLLMVQDVTLQKKLQREITEKQSAIQEAYQDLLKQNRMLKELDVAKDRFIAMTTHELRTPISALVASAEILKLKLFDSSEQHDEFVGILYEQGQQLLSLVNDILDFAKIQAGRMDYYVDQANIAPCIQKEIDNRNALAKASQVQINFASPAAPLTCYFDELRTRQVIGNLLNNAINYNKPNGRVEVQVNENDDFVFIAFIDTGIGIAGENLQKIFNEFETLGAIANHSKGTGLGLPISQKIARRMGGDITVASEIGRGSTFTFSLPKKRVLNEDDYRTRAQASGDSAA